MGLPVRDQNDVLSEAVPDHAGHRLAAPKGNCHLFAGIHGKVLLAVGGHLKVGILLLSGARKIGDYDICHLVHPVVAHFLIDMIKGYQVVVLVVPDQAIRRDSIPLAVPAKDLLARNVVVEIFEGDGLLGGQRPMEPVYIIICLLYPSRCV